MSADHRLMLKQPPAGAAPGKDLLNEKWMIVALTQNWSLNLKDKLTPDFINDWTAAQQFPIYGTFSIVNANNMRSPNIGGLSSASNFKYWRYSANEMRLYFGTLYTETVTPGQGKAYEKTFSAVDEVVLYDAVYIGTHIIPLGYSEMNPKYGNGAVLVNSAAGALTTSAALFWRPE